MMGSTKSHHFNETGEIDRRAFITSVSAAGALLTGRSYALPGPRRLHLPRHGVPPRVVVTQSSKVVKNGIVHETILRESLEASLTRLTGADSLEDAWLRLLKPEDVIGLKFNRSGQQVIGTTRSLAGILIKSLLSAGWDSRQIVCIEAPLDVERIHRTTHPWPGYADQATDFGSGSDELAAVLDQVTALINVPFLKTHNIAGLTCAMKNLSHGLIKHPARYHGNGCSPFVADIVALPQIRSKIRLCLVDALRVVYDGGPDPIAGTLSEEGIIISSLDPVATDAVALMQLNSVRKKFKLQRIADAPAEVGYLAAGHLAGIGVALLHGIELVRVFP